LPVFEALWTATGMLDNPYGRLVANACSRIMNFVMTIEVNQGIVGDTAKLIMHRLIARQIRRDPALVEKAKIAHARQADQFAGWPFVREWNELPAGRAHFEAY
jgi:hypothetical protein